jgi:carotenoid cleavage dioxygenase-like enzyme
MVTSLKNPQTHSWAKAIAKPGQEFGLTTLPIITGSIPVGLKGSLYRNGPGRLQQGEMKVGHWFDGDGAILAVHFDEGEVRATYKYVQTAGYQAEMAAEKYLYGNYGMTAPGAIWQQWRNPSKNAANTSVLALPDRLLALWEGGQPHSLDLETLATQGEDDLGNSTKGFSYSAHPKRDPVTGEIFNFGMSFGRQISLNIYKSDCASAQRSDRTGQIIQSTAIPIPFGAMVHDFVLAGEYLIFCIPPVQMKTLPLLMGLSSYSDACYWQPELGTKILVIDRQTLSIVSQGEAESWFQWHFGNGYVNVDGEVVLDLVRYSDFSSNQYLKEVATGQPETLAPGTLWQMRLNPQTGTLKKMELVVNRGCEFPVVSPLEVGQPSRYTYFSSSPVGVDFSTELSGAIARFDYETGKLTVADLGSHRYPSEPIYAPDGETGWIVTVVYDSQNDSSEVWVYDSDRLDDEPVCRLGLPEVIPFGFHGTWRSY